MTDLVELPVIERVRSVCSYCGVGCGVVLDVVRDADGRRIVGKVSGDKEHPANRGRLCTKGSTAAALLSAPGRLAQAAIRPRRDDPLRPVAVDAATAETGRRLRAIVDEHGPDSVAFYVSGQMTLEAQYLITKLAKGFVGTNRIESNSRLCMASASTGYKLSLGADGPPGSYDDFDLADLFLVTGSNMADCHPVLFLRLLERRKAGARLIVVDPRRTETAEKADLFLQLRPGSDVALLNGLLRLIVEAGAVDEDFIAAATEGWVDLLPLLDDYPAPRVAALTGIAEADLRTAAEWIAQTPNWMSCWTMGLNQSSHGTANTTALCNLHLATGSICRPGAGPFSLTGQPNAMGGREMGYMGAGLPGQRSVDSAADRAFIEELWGLPAGAVPAEGVVGAVDMFERMSAGEIKAAWIICTNPVASMANRDRVTAGLEAAELVVVQDAFADTETARQADVLLPAAMWGEADGVMVNSERTMTLSRQAVEPPGDALPDWRLIQDVARAMGYGDAFDYRDAAQIIAEIAGTSNARTGYAVDGLSHDRLAEGPVQWPAAAGGARRNPIRYLADADAAPGAPPRFPTASGRARFVARPHMEPAERPDDDFPFLLNTGRVAHQWHTMTKTGKVPALNRLAPAPFVEIHPLDAAALRIAEGDVVEIASRRGVASLPASITDRVLPGSCFAPFHWGDLFADGIAINAVTSDAVDPQSLQPEFKAAAVSLRRAAVQPVRVAAPAHAGSSSAANPSGVAAPSLGASAAARIATLLGIENLAPPAIDESQRRYLAGFLASAGSMSIQLPADAPLSSSAASWINGALAAAFGGSALPLARPASAATADPVGALDAPCARPLVVAWASQTGTAEQLARIAARQLSDDDGVAAPTLLPMSDARTLPAPGSDWLVVTSTFGDGDPPDNGVPFTRLLHGAQELRDVRFAVVALGDSSYSEFCGQGRRLDGLLESLGASRLAPRLEIDAGDSSRLESWLVGLGAALADTSATAPSAASPSGAASGGGASSATAPSLAPPDGSTPLDATAPPSRRSGLAIGRLAGTRRLSGPGSDKDVREFVIDLTDTSLTYEPGDAIGIWSRNDPALVDQWLTALQAGGDELVEVRGVGPTRLADALLRHLEITVTSDELLRFAASRTENRDLRRLVVGTAHDELAKWKWNRQAIDVITAFAPIAPIQEHVDALRRLAPRQYSISSSPLAMPRAARTLTSIVSFRTEQDAVRRGLCSAHLCDAGGEAQLAVFIQRADRFRLPEDGSTPIVMIGPGTGLAPFLGFLEHRAALGSTGRSWLFFGEQRGDADFHYRDRLEQWLEEGVLTRLDTAFSRDQRSKIYVQDRMREHGAQLWSWLEDGAVVYVCGDASRMAGDVHRALVDIAARHGGMDPEDAAHAIDQLTAGGRYRRDVY